MEINNDMDFSTKRNKGTPPLGTDVSVKFIKKAGIAHNGTNTNGNISVIGFIYIFLWASLCILDLASDFMYKKEIAYAIMGVIMIISFKALFMVVKLKKNKS